MLAFINLPQPPLHELDKAINRQAARMSPGKDGISPDIVKCAICQLLQYLHTLLLLCWRVDGVPQDMCNGNIAILYKNKG